MNRENRRDGIKVLAIFFSLPFVFLLWHGCGGGGGGGSSTPISPAKATITGTVPGTLIYAFGTDGSVKASAEATGSPKRFVLTVDPGTYFLRFEEFESTPQDVMYTFVGSTGSNLFTFPAGATVDLGQVNFDNVTGVATSAGDPFSGTGITQTTSPNANISGDWEFTNTQQSTCPGIIGRVEISTGTITQNGSRLALLATSPPDAGATYYGNIAGNLVYISSSDPAGTFFFNAFMVFQADGTMAGTYTTDDLNCHQTGSIVAIRSSSVPAQVAGYWNMFFGSYGDSTYISVTQNGNSIAGQALCGVNELLTWTGTISGNSISFSGAPSGGFTFNCSGNVNATTIQGTCSGSYNNNNFIEAFTVTLHSQAPTDKQCVIASTEAFCVYFPNNSQYWVMSVFDDPNAIVQSANISGPYITGTSPYTYNLYPDQPGRWWTDPNIFISTGTTPTLPLNYSINVNFKDATSSNVSRSTGTTCEVAQ